MFETGYLTVARLRGAPVRLHWTIPVGAFVFGGMHLSLGGVLGFVAIVLLHELGHAAMVLGLRQRLFSVDVHGLGGVCRWSGTATGRRRALIAWGGVLAQGVLLLAALAWRKLAGPVASPLGAQLMSTFIDANLWLMAVNLMPVPPLDGAEAWTIFRRPSAAAPRAKPSARRTTTPPGGHTLRVGPRVAAPRVTTLDDIDDRAPEEPLPPEVRAAVERIIEESKRRARSGKIDTRPKN